MDEDDLDHLIDMDPFMEQPPMGHTVWQCPPAGTQAVGAEPFAAPSPQPARLLPLLVDEPTVCTPEARKRGQLVASCETPPQIQSVKRRSCGKRPDAEGFLREACGEAY